MFVWTEFLDARGIPYSTTGRRATAGNVAINCPFCGNSTNPLALSTKAPIWHCYACKEGKGSGPARLVKALLGCSWDEASAITGARRALPNNFMDEFLRLMNGGQEDAEAERLKRDVRLPPEFRDIDERQACVPFVNYLRGRGFSTAQIMRLSDDYGLRIAKSGPFRMRIVFPVVHRKKLITWSARTIRRGVEPRYKVLPTDPDKAAKEGLKPAAGTISQFLLWYDDIAKADADTLMVVEGPFDALKVNVLGEADGVVATCFFTNNMSERQCDLLAAIAPRFKRRFVLLDRDAFGQSMRVRSNLRAANFQSLYLPAGIKDPGELSRPILRRMIN